MLTSLKVTLTLRCLQGSGPIYCRAVLLDSEKYRVAVGRSSKVETKNLVAAPDNFWFDNPVLSRNHAEFIVFPRQEEAYLMDTKSLHGTYVNGVKLFGERRVLLEDGDMITFGAKVTRGTEVHEPLKTRIKLEWRVADVETDNLGDQPLTSVGQRTRTFMAPDDDDDSDLDGDGDMSDLDVPDAQRVPSSDAASNVLSPASSAKEEIAEPPITSPFSHADNERPAAVHDPTLLRGPGLSQRPYLQTTSKVLNNCSGTKSLFGGDQSDHICQSKDAEESEGELSISSRQNPEPKETTEQGQEKKREFAIPLFPTSLARLPAEDTPTTPESMLRESNVPCSVSPQVSFTRPTTKSHGSPPWRTSEPKVHRGSLPPGVTEVVYPGRETAPMRKPFHSTNAGWVSWPAEPYSSSQNHHMRPKYKDGLFSEDETAAVPQNCTFYSDGYSANLGPNKPVSRPMHEHEPVESLNPMLLQASQEYRRRELPPPNPHGLFESPYNGEDPLASFLEVFRPAKRKFDEADLYHRAEEERVTQNLRAVEEHMEREIAAEELQQREVISETVKLDSQPTEDRQPTPAPEKSERPRKRARTIKKPHSRARTLAKYAATAAAGAVAGSIGAIVALASLPPNFFD